MTLPVAKAPPAAAVPDDLRSLRGWLHWRYEPGPKKPLKVPYYVDGAKRYGSQGSDQDRARLVTFNDAAAAAKPGYGLGLAMLPDWGLVALDFDNVAVDGRVLPEVEELVACTYAEMSPSGNGVRAFMRGASENRKSREPYGFETFHSSGFVTITGDRLDVCDLVGGGDIVPITAEVRAFGQARFGMALGPPAAAQPIDDLERAVVLNAVRDETVVEFASALAMLDPDDRDTWIEAGLAAKSLEQAGSLDAFEVWRDWSARSPKFDGDEALAKWNGFAPSKITYRSVFARAAAAGWTNPKAGSPVTKVEPIETHAGRRFVAHSLATIATQAPQDYLVKGVIPRAPLVVVFGESGAGKTFMVLDLVMAIARGLPWREKRVRAGRVVYVAAEGQGGFRSRLAAYCQHHGVETTIPFRVVTDVPNLLSKDHEELATEIAVAGGADIIVIDTLAQTTPGANENSSEDMGLALKACGALHRATAATILLVHHAGKDLDRGARGWSGLKAAADAELSVEHIGETRTLRVSKMKDGRGNETFGFRLQSVAVGVDEDGEVIESAVVEASEAVPERPVKGMGANQRAVLEAARTLCEDDGDADSETVLQAAVELLPPPRDESKRDRRYEIASRALEALVTTNWLKFANGRVEIFAK